MKKVLFVLLAAMAVVLGSRAAGQQRVAELDVVLFERDLMIPMRDGVKLATDIYRPAVNGVPVTARLPLLLQRTPYNKTGQRLAEQARYLAAQGYVVVLQDERGAYKSEGVQSKYVGYGKDGYDTIEFLATQPYTDGQVGMWGTSYAAHTQAGPAILNPPHLKTIVLNMGGLYNGWFYKIRNHGAFELAQQTSWAFQQLAAQTKNPLASAVAKSEKAVDWISVLQARRGLNPLSVAPNFEDYFFEIMTRADYDEYWKESDRNWSLYFDRTADIPMLHISGWYDSYPAGTVLNYQGLAKLKSSPVRLLMGPWLHSRNTQSYAGDVEFGPSASIEDFATTFHLRWFDHFLKRKDNGVGSEPAVRLFVMGTGDGHKDQNGRLYHGGYWKTTTAWPPPETKFTDYYLHADGSLSTSMPRVTGASTAYTYDPRDPVPTIGGSFTGSDIAAAGAFDQREREYTGEASKGFFGSKPPYLPLKARPDVVVFQTDPLTGDLEIIGPIVVNLFAASSAPDTDFTAKLVDVYPPSADYPRGYDMNLTDGIVRARYRNSAEKPELMKPGDVYRFQIELPPTANVFKKGHRIRIDISSSNFPRFDVNPNTGGPLGHDRRMVSADNSVYHDAKHPSSVVLPVIGRPTPPSTANPGPRP
jgi:putative CocE/NonD family hydrolase